MRLSPTAESAGPAYRFTSAPIHELDRAVAAITATADPDAQDLVTAKVRTVPRFSELTASCAAT